MATEVTTRRTDLSWEKPGCRLSAGKTPMALAAPQVVGIPEMEREDGAASPPSGLAISSRQA